MRWEELTWPRFAEAVTEVNDVCVVPLGVVESHAGRLPVGTDYVVGEAPARRAGAVEPAIVFPTCWFSVFPGGLYQPGGINVGYEFAFDLLEDICAEVSRNGLKKIIQVSRHWWVTGAGVHDFAQATMHAERDYAVYVVPPGRLSPGDDPAWQEMRSTPNPGFGSEELTSLMLAAFPDLVDMGETRGDGKSCRRLGDLAGVQVAVQMYAEHPDMYARDATCATREKGQYLLDFAVARLAETIAAVKADTQAAAALRKYYDDFADPVRAQEGDR